MDDLVVRPEDFERDQWCAGCSREVTAFRGRCQRCGSRTEPTGVGDDDPYPDDPTWAQERRDA